MNPGSGGAGLRAAGRALLPALLCLLACWAGASLIAPPAARAVINDTDGDTGPSEGPCALSIYNFRLEGNLVVVGLPFAGGPVRIDATSAKLVGTKATATRICETLLFPIPRFQWGIAATPPGQAAAIANANTLSPSVNVAGPGAYRIRLTACSPSCRLTLSGRSRTIGPLTREVTINAVSEFTPPPETEAVPPPLSPPPQNWFGPRTAPPSFTSAQREKACQGGGGVKDPQWVTAERFRGVGDYRTVEGEVESSHIARQDDFLNHDSQDHNWHVKPDPPFSGLSQPPGRREMEMELETDHLPREFRPTSGDRSATIGYWIFDCGHEFQTEIHPAVGLAVQRPRPVQIPSSFRAPGFPNGFGSNVLVPGIVTDILFNRASGEITNNCSTTGLHQPPVTVTVRGVSVTTDGPCIREPHPVNGRFTFNVYLPRDPRPRARELGLDPPPVPLFVGTQTIAPGGGGPDPSVQVRQDAASGATWLEVTVDLSGFSGSAYGRRISAAWAYPQAQNWGARRWRVRLDNFEVFEDAEPDNPGPDLDGGDWRLFFNTNNRDREWTRIFKCDGCVDEGDTKTLNLETGGAGLGPDPVLFPGQTIFVHTTGFDDEVAGDDTGSVFLRMGQRNASGVKAFSQGGEGIYHLNFSIRESTPVGGAVLTPEAGALMSAYTLRAPPQCVAAQTLFAVGPGQVGRPCGAAARDPNLDQTWHPDSLVLGTRVLRAGDLEIFETGETEQHTVQGLSVAGFRRLFGAMRPVERDRVLDEIKRELRAVPVPLRGDYDELVATLDRTLPPRLVARALPAGFRASVRPSPLIARR
jgi:hypothetical protein